MGPLGTVRSKVVKDAVIVPFLAQLKEGSGIFFPAALRGAIERAIVSFDHRHFGKSSITSVPIEIVQDLKTTSIAIHAEHRSTLVKSSIFSCPIKRAVGALDEPGLGLLAGGRRRAEGL